VTVGELVKKFPPFMEPEGSLPCTQQPAQELFEVYSPKHSVPSL